MSSDGAEEWFADRWGYYPAEGRLVSRLVHHYPRKAGKVLERLYDLRLAVSGAPLRIATAAARRPERRRILVVGVEVASRADWMARVRTALADSRHDVTVATKEVEGQARVPNLNALLARHDLSGFDWVITTDDDIELPAGFTDRFVFLLEHFGLMIGQPAHNLLSYASYELNRRAWGTVARRTGFVEIGPLTAFHRTTFAKLLPFPDVGMGHGLDVHWAYVAEREGWPIGVIDALPIRHLRPIAASYDGGPSVQAGVNLIRARGGLPRRRALRTIQVFRTI
jgi:hypothetical protein